VLPGLKLLSVWTLDKASQAIGNTQFLSVTGGSSTEILSPTAGLVQGGEKLAGRLAGPGIALATGIDALTHAGCANVGLQAGGYQTPIEIRPLPRPSRSLERVGKPESILSEKYEKNPSHLAQSIVWVIENRFWACEMPWGAYEWERSKRSKRGPIRGFFCVISGVECGLYHLVSMSCVTLPKWHGRGHRFDPDQAHQINQ